MRRAGALRLTGARRGEAKLDGRGGVEARQGGDASHLRVLHKPALQRVEERDEHPRRVDAAVPNALEDGTDGSGVVCGTSEVSMGNMTSRVRIRTAVMLAVQLGGLLDQRRD